MTWHIDLRQLRYFMAPAEELSFRRPGDRAPRSWAERTYHKLIYWNEAEKGGHFAAFGTAKNFHCRHRHQPRG